MCPSGMNTVDNWPGIPEVICSVEEYFQTRGGAFENVLLFCLIIISVLLPGILLCWIPSHLEVYHLK